MKTEQSGEIFKGITDPGDVAEIERTIAEAKGNIQVEHTTDFWAGKTPCCEMVHCPQLIKSECPAAKNRSLPCWEIEGTYCKLGRHGLSGLDTSICEVCRVYKRWGNGKLIEIKLFGQGGLRQAKLRGKQSASESDRDRKTQKDRGWRSPYLSDTQMLLVPQFFSFENSLKFYGAPCR